MLCIWALGSDLVMGVGAVAAFGVGCDVLFFFFKQKTAYELRISDWSSDVCSSDLGTKGSIVNTASVAGVVGVPMHGEYVGAKHAVVGLTRVAAADYGKHGIRVNALVPGAVRTPMLQRAMDNDAGLEPYLNSIH